MADTYKGDGYQAVLTDHFLERMKERVREGTKIPYDRIFRAIRRWPERKCRALLNNKYWVICKYEPAHDRVVFLTLMPKSFILPEPSIWVLV